MLSCTSNRIKARHAFQGVIVLYVFVYKVAFTFNATYATGWLILIFCFYSLLDKTEPIPTTMLLSRSIYIFYQYSILVSYNILSLQCQLVAFLVSNAILHLSRIKHIKWLHYPSFRQWRQANLCFHIQFVFKLCPAKHTYVGWSMKRVVKLHGVDVVTVTMQFSFYFLNFSCLLRLIKVYDYCVIVLENETCCTFYLIERVN